jgi:nucleotide-binding universal stress UspA family protein
MIDSSSRSSSFRDALDDFRRARQRAALESIVARLTGKSTELLSYEEITRKLRPTGRSDRGFREIPLDAIVGSVGRYTDFTRSFLPRQESDKQRWATVKAAVGEYTIDALPPIEVYQIGAAYFVKDGNHRVSVARREGYSHIHAYVTEVRTRVPLAPDDRPDDIILKAEYAAFLEFTRLDELRPAADLSVSVPGQYAHLEDHVEAHRYFREVEQGRDIPYSEAVCLWYDEVYTPAAQTIREQGILRYFPGRTVADLYLWVSEHRVALQRALGWQVSPESAAAKLAAQFKPRRQRVAGAILNAVLPDTLKTSPATGQFRRERLVDRYSNRLFADILVPISPGATSWSALDHALMVAQREGGRLHGLHVAASESAIRGGEAQSIQAEFRRRCETAGISGQLGVESGEIAAQICERAVMTDLIVLDLAHPPDPRPLARLGSKMRAIIHRSPRPVLAVLPSMPSLARALLAYDGSAKAKEALFVAAYLAERWNIPLVVVSAMETGRISEEALDYARKYLDMHEAQAAFVQASGPAAEIISKTAEERACDLLIMGGYGLAPLQGAVLGSTVDRVLRESRWPVLICR